LTDTVIGLSVTTAQDYFTALTARLTAAGAQTVEPGHLDLTRLRALDGVREFPARVKCATLAWHALDSAIRGQATPVSTE
jgi:nitrogen fixation NifU-like protein